MPTTTCIPSIVAAHALPGEVLEVGGLAQFDVPLLSSERHRSGNGMFAGRLDGTGQVEETLLVLIGPDVGQAHHPPGEGAGLVEQDGLDSSRTLENFGALEDDAQFRAAAASDHDGGWGGQAESARTGDDQYGYGRGQGLSDVVGGYEPAAKRGQGNHHDDRDENTRDTVGEFLDGCLGRLRLLDQMHDLCQGGVCTDSISPDGQETLLIDRGSIDVVPRSLVDGNRLTRQHAFVERRTPLFNGTVGWHLFAGLDQDHVADPNVFDRDHHRLSVPKDPGLLGS